MIMRKIFIIFKHVPKFFWHGTARVPRAGTWEPYQIVRNFSAITDLMRCTKILYEWLRALRDKYVTLPLFSNLSKQRRSFHAPIKCAPISYPDHGYDFSVPRSKNSARLTCPCAQSKIIFEKEIWRIFSVTVPERTRRLFQGKFTYMKDTIETKQFSFFFCFFCCC